MASKNSQTIPSPSPRPMGPLYPERLFLFLPVALGQKFRHSFSPYGIDPKVHQDFLPLWPWARNPEIFSPPAPLVKPECPLLSKPFHDPTIPKGQWGGQHPTIPTIQWGRQYPILPKIQRGRQQPHHPKSSEGTFMSPTLQKVENCDSTPLHSLSPSRKNKSMVVYVPKPQNVVSCVRDQVDPTPPPPKLREADYGQRKVMGREG